MVQAFANSWALLLGVFLLMIGNGIQGTLLGIRGDMEGFSTLELSFVMSAYFAGFLGGSQLAPELIRRVGHIRVFAALGSFISAVLILYPAITEPWAWIALRTIFGFCMCGVYVTAESWLNSSSTNELRGQTLSLYLIVQMAGITAAQALPALGDPAGFMLFVIPSVLVSISFAPILLSVTPTPPFGTAKRMAMRDLFKVSPLGSVGVLIMGGVYSALFGMASVYGTLAGYTVTQISTYIAAIYIGGLVFQFPIGWLSDKIDRRVMILITATCAAVFAALPILGLGFTYTLGCAVLLGGCTNPLYGLLLSHTNDFLEQEDMASASGQLMFLNGASAVIGPVITGVAMNLFGPAGFFVFLTVILASLAVYASYRMTQRPVPHGAEGGEFAAVLPTASAITMEAAHEVYGHHEAASEAGTETAPNGAAQEEVPEEDEEEDVAV